MTSLLLPSAVALLAHKRLADAVEALERKVNADVADIGALGGVAPVTVQDAERRVLGLASAALELFEAGERIDAPARLQVGRGLDRAGAPMRALGRFAILGAAGLELPGYADLLAPGGAWVADAIRRGTPDPNMSRVVVGTTQLAVRAGELGLRKTTDRNERARIQAFSMGLLSAVAGGVMMGPVLRGLEARRSRREWNRHRPEADLGAAEARVRAELLGGGGAGALWQGWWPASGDVPDALYDGFLDALEEAYQLSGNRPRGFADFESGFQPGDPLDRRRLRNAYALLRQDTAFSQWTMGGWYAALTAVLLLPTLGLIIVRELPSGRFFFTTASPVTGASVDQALTVGLGLGALAPFGYSLWLRTQIPEQDEAFIEAVVLFAVRASLAVASFATLGASTAVRAVLLALLLATDGYAIGRAIYEGAHDRPGVAFLFALQALPIANASLTLLYAALMKAAGVNSTLAFWLGLIPFTAFSLLAIGLPVAYLLSRTGGILRWFVHERPELPLLDTLAAAAGPAADPAALALLFDDATLWHDPGREPPALGDLRYPAGPRALVRLWWTGAGAMSVNHDEHIVTFEREDGGRLPVILPPAPRTAAAVADQLKAALPGLEAEVIDPGDPAYDLPFPHMLADPGDDRPTLAEHAARRGDFLPVGTTREHAYVLRHTPRVELTTPYGGSGPSRNPLDGIGLVPGRTLGDLEDTALGMAADLAVLLAMGAAPTLRSPVGAAPSPNRPPIGGALGPVYQVFRQWNLDERRVNEWRMLVEGGAESEKAGNPAARDPAMRPGPPGYVSAAAGGERVATAMGWLPLWRAWLRMAGDPLADTNAAVPRPYTPEVATRDGSRIQPTNRQLTEAIRFLLDLP